jgi:cell division protein FtsQ
MAAGVAARGLSRQQLLVWRRRAIALAGIAVVLIAGYWFWLRNSSLVAVHEVKVEGATIDREEITAALEKAGKDMTTLHIRDGELAKAVSGFPTVASIRADSHLLHELTVTVTERPPVAVVKVKGHPFAVAADGLLLPGVDHHGLPALDASDAPNGRLDEEGAAQAAVLGATPDALQKDLESSTWSEDQGGVVVDLAGAPELRFGDGSRAEAKWQAVAAVLSHPDKAAPGYLDVSVPERPVGGG